MGDAGIAPRIIRLRSAPAYLGMDRQCFNKEVRPHITAILLGIQGIAFDRLDLDAWLNAYKRRKGCPAQRSIGIGSNALSNDPKKSGRALKMAPSQSTPARSGRALT